MKLYLLLFIPSLRLDFQPFKSTICFPLLLFCKATVMENSLILKNHLKDVRAEKSLSQTQLAEMVGVSRNTISSIETGQFNPTAKLALILCIALDKKFEDLFYFE